MRAVRTSIVTAVAIVCLTLGSIARAEGITFTITTDANTYNVGDTVNYTIVVDIVGSSAATNFGIATAGLDLQDSLGEVFVTGSATIDPTFSGSGYAPTGGFWDGTELIEITATSIFQGASIGADNQQTTNLPFATGSYMVTTQGVHTLIGSPGDANDFYGAPGIFNGQPGTMAYAPVAFNNATFSVVPEPGAASLMLASLGAVLIRRRRS